MNSNNFPEPSDSFLLHNVQTQPTNICPITFRLQKQTPPSDNVVCLVVCCNGEDWENTAPIRDP